MGWSNGGAVALQVADIAPERLASITMLASVGAQETEGSGEYYFEHGKYALGLVALGAVDLLPHFGLLGERRERLGWLWNFWETDQRPLGEVMANLDTPTLILHGRHDFLTRDRAAERHHELIPTSRLVMLDGSHFMPFTQPATVADHLVAHFKRHDTPGVEPLIDYFDLAPKTERTGWRAALERWLGVFLSWGWWWQALVVVPLAWWKRDVAIAFVGWVVSAGWLDFGVASVGLLIGTLAGQRRELTVLRAVGHVFGTVFALAFTRLIGSRLVEIGAAQLGLVGFVFGVLGSALSLFILSRVWTKRGRQEIDAAWLRVIRYEYWASWVFYAPLGPWLVWLAIRHRGALLFSAVNPGIANGGGIVGESKDQILSGFGEGREHLLAHALIPSGQTDERLAAFESVLESRPELGGYPVILKPDSAQRGYGLRLVRDRAGARAALEQLPDALIAQRFHPGPHEVGVPLDPARRRSARRQRGVHLLGHAQGVPGRGRRRRAHARAACLGRPAAALPGRYLPCTVPGALAHGPRA